MVHLNLMVSGSINFAPPRENGLTEDTIAGRGGLDNGGSEDFNPASFTVRGLSMRIRRYAHLSILAIIELIMTAGQVHWNGPAGDQWNTASSPYNIDATEPFRLLWVVNRGSAEGEYGRASGLTLADVGPNFVPVIFGSTGSGGNSVYRKSRIDGSATTWFSRDGRSDIEDSGQGYRIGMDAAATRIYYLAENRTLRAYSAVDNPNGSPIWEVQAGSADRTIFHWFKVGPDDKIYGSDDRYGPFSLHPDTGHLIWYGANVQESFQNPGAFYSGPKTNFKTYFVLNGNGTGIYAFDTESALNAPPEWTHTDPTDSRGVAGPTIDPTTGDIYAFKAPRVLKLDISDGTIIWESDPVGEMEVANQHGALSRDGRTYYLQTTVEMLGLGRLYAFDAASGRLRWSWPTGAVSYDKFGGPVVSANGCIFVGNGRNTDPRIYCLRDDGLSGTPIDTLQLSGESNAPHLAIGPPGVLYLDAYFPDGTDHLVAYGRASLSGLPSAFLKFPTTTVGQQASMNFTLTNHTQAPIQLSSVDVIGDGFRLTPSFRDSVLSGLVTIAPGASRTDRITFQPLHQGPVSGVLQFTGVDALTEQVRFELIASGRKMSFASLSSILYPDGKIDQGSSYSFALSLLDSATADSATVRIQLPQGRTRSFPLSGPEPDPVNGFARFRADIPFDSIGVGSILYSLVAHSGPLQFTGPTEQLRTRVFQVESPNLIKALNYKLISMPFELDKTLLALFGDDDDLGPVSKSHWRMFDYSAEGDSAVEVPSSPGFQLAPGRGYWLISKDDVTLDTGPEVVGRTIPVNEDFRLVLNRGWNLVSNPFLNPICWTAAEGGCDSLPSGILDGPYAWDAQHGYECVDRLMPFEGYWVKNLHEGAIEICLSPFAQDCKDSEPRPVPFERKQVQFDNPDSWVIRMSLTGQGDDVSRFSYVGAIPGALSGWDPIELPEPPTPPGRFPRLFFPRPGWTPHAGDYASDVRDPQDFMNGIVSWPFQVDPGSSVTSYDLTFELDRVPPELEVVLVDRHLNYFLSVRELPGGRHPITPVPNQSNRWELVVYPRELPSEAVGSVLPGNQSTRFIEIVHLDSRRALIRYELQNTTDDVRLDVFDIQGRHIKQLVNGTLSGGVHESEWDGRSMTGGLSSAGIYFVRLRTGTGGASCKLRLP